MHRPGSELWLCPVSCLGAGWGGLDGLTLGLFRSVKHPISPQLLSSSGASGGEGRQSMGRPDFWTGAGKAGEAGANSFPRHDGQLGRWLSARRSERGHGRAAAESGATDGALRGRGVLHAPHDRRARERDAGSIRRLRAGFVSVLRHRGSGRPCNSHMNEGAARTDPHWSETPQDQNCSELVPARS